MRDEVCQQDVELPLPKNWPSCVRDALLNVIGRVRIAMLVGRESLIKNGDLHEARIGFAIFDHQPDSVEVRHPRTNQSKGNTPPKIHWANAVPRRSFREQQIASSRDPSTHTCAGIAQCSNLSGVE